QSWGGLDDPIPGPKLWAIGTWNVTSLGGKEPELVREVERYRLEIVGLASTHSLGSGTQLLERGWTLHYSGVAQGERRRAGVGLLIAPQLSRHVLEFTPVNERVASLRLRVGDGIVHVAWHQDTLGRRSMIDFVVVSSDLRPYVLDTRVKRGAELSTDHHLVVSWIRWQRRKLDRPGRPKRIVRVCWERNLAEPSVREVFNSHLRKSFSQIPREAGDIESEWTMFSASIVDAAWFEVVDARSLVPVVAVATPRTRWWTPKKQAKQATARTVLEAKTRVWEEFGEAMEEDYRSASKRFWQTVRCLRRGKQYSANTVYSAGGELLTSTGDIVGRWKKYFEDLLNPTDLPSNEEAEAGVSEVDSSITQAEVTEVVRKLLAVARRLGVDEIRPEYLKSLDVVGLSWLTRLCNIAWRLGTVPLEWQTGVVVPLFKK
ncbi:hypothetical protein L3Q82_019871, partial [Scortum barcoo]